MRLFRIAVVPGWLAILSIPLCSAQQPNLDRRTTIEVNSASPQDVFASLARTLGCDLAMAPEIKQPITMRLSNVTVRTALNAISESIGCHWSVRGNLLQVDLGAASPGGVVGGVPGGVREGVGKGVGGGVVGGVPGGVGGGVRGGVMGGVPGGVIGGVDFKERLERKTPADFRFDNAPIEDVMNALGKIADLETRMEGSKTGQRVTLDLGDRTVLAAFRTIQQQVGLNQSVVFAASVPGSDRKMLFKMGPQKKQ